MKKRGTYTEVEVYVLFVCLKLGKNFLVNEKNYLPKVRTRAKKNVASNCVRCRMRRDTFILIGCFSRIDDQGVEYDIAMEYIKSNEANPGEIGLNYVEIRKLDSDGKKSSLWKLVLHGSKFENDVES